MATGAVFNNSGYNYSVPTVATTPVTTNTPAAVALYGTSPTIANPAYSQSAADAASSAMANWQSNGGVDGNGNPTAAPAAYSVPQTIQGPVAQAPTLPTLNPIGGTNSGDLTPRVAYSTTTPSQSSYNWAPQTAGSGTTLQSTNTPSQAWGTGNGTAQASFDPQAYISWMLQPSVQAGFAGMAVKRQQ